MTVFIAHAPADAAAAEALEKYLERRGLFVERETGERGFRFAQPRDAVVVLWSRDSVFTPYRLVTEKRALDAWADQQLVFVKLDHHLAPVGLRDLAAVDAAFEPQREIAWAAVAKKAQDIQTGEAQSAEEAVLDRKRSAPEVQLPPSSPPSSDAKADDPTPRGSGAEAVAQDWVASFLVLLAIPAGAFFSLALGMRDPAWPIVWAGVFLAGLWGVSKWRERAKGSAGAPPVAAPAPGAPSGPATFISYAHADAGAVLPVVDQVAAGGKAVWIDRAGIQAGDGWAGEIVRAIKAAEGVVVMCSSRAFESDHVRREVYLADRYKKRLLPVFLEAAAAPEDFEYFFADVQQLKLFETPEGERARALAQAWPAR